MESWIFRQTSSERKRRLEDQEQLAADEDLEVSVRSVSELYWNDTFTSVSIDKTLSHQSYGEKFRSR